MTSPTRGRQPGNSNAGHVYPQRGYSEKERWAVIEYLKLAALPESSAGSKN
jgi:hypothetical protein